MHASNTSYLSKSVETAKRKWRPLLAVLAVSVALNIILSTIFAGMMTRWAFSGVQNAYGVDIQKIVELSQQSTAGDKEAEVELYSLTADYVEKFAGKEEGDKMRELAEKARQGDAEAKRAFDLRLADHLEKVIQGEDAEQQFNNTMKKSLMGTAGAIVLPALALGTLLSFIHFIAALLYFSIGTMEDAGTGKTLRRSLVLLIPMFGLSIWAFFRSKAWLALLAIVVHVIGKAGDFYIGNLSFWLLIAGVLAFFILMPRFMLSPVFLIREKKGISEAAQASFERTEQSWKMILLNVVLISVAMSVVSYIAKQVLTVLAPIAPNIIFYMASIKDEVVILAWTLLVAQMCIFFFEKKETAKPKEA